MGYGPRAFFPAADRTCIPRYGCRSAHFRSGALSFSSGTRSRSPFFFSSTTTSPSSFTNVASIVVPATLFQVRVPSAAADFFAGAVLVDGTGFAAAAGFFSS